MIKSFKVFTSSKVLVLQVKLFSLCDSRMFCFINFTLYNKSPINLYRIKI